MKKYEKEGREVKCSREFCNYSRAQQERAQRTAAECSREQQSSLEREEERGKMKDKVEGRCKRVQGLHIYLLSHV